MKVLKKIMKIIGIVLLIFLAVIGAYNVYQGIQYAGIKAHVEKIEAERTYDKDLLYLEPYGTPTILVDAKNTKTLFFVEGFRGQAGAGIYKPWFKELFEKHNINVISPIIGLQGWPFDKRNQRDWFYQEDMRQVLQIYDAYTANLPEDHVIVTGSQSFGTLQNLTILAKSMRKPDAAVLVSPFNTGSQYKNGGALVQWLATQKHWLKHILPYTKRGKNPERATAWDIVNDEKSLEVWENITKHIINPEENLFHGAIVDEAAKYMENELIPQVKNSKIVLIHGDDDHYFTQEGFQMLTEKLRSAGNVVERVICEDSGHMIFFDNGEEKAKNIFLNLLNDNYKVKNN